MPPTRINQGVLENPAHAGRIWAKRGRDPIRKLAGEPLQIFDDTTSCPIDIGAVFKDHIDEREAKERLASDIFDTWPS